MFKEKTRQLKWFWLIAIVVGFLIMMYAMITAPLDSQPTGRISAARLALSIARVADCGDFEYYDTHPDYYAFTCQKIINKEEEGDVMFILYSFYSKEGRDKLIKKLSGEKSTSLFKVGDFFVIQSTDSFDAGEAMTPIHRVNKTDYDSFPGEFSIPAVAP